MACPPVYRTGFVEVFALARVYINGKHPKSAVLIFQKKPLYDRFHIRALCYLQFMGSSLINSSSFMSSKGFAKTRLNHP